MNRHRLNCDLFQNSSAPGSPSIEHSQADDMEGRVQQYGNWVIQALPVLLEIVRKGGRYTEDSIAGLRESFKVNK
jgi:hypothetical protein